MEVIKRFENKLGYTELQKYDNDWVVVLHSDLDLIEQFKEYKFKKDAIETFQFNKQWLIVNNKNVCQ